MTPDFPTWLPVPSPNMWPGRKVPVSGVVMHFTAAGSGKATADYFSKKEVSWTENGQQKTAQVQASAHVVIDRDGVVYQCVSFADRAWHAGPATLWKGKPVTSNVNDFTIGIEIANWGRANSGPNGQYLNYLGKPFAPGTSIVQATSALRSPRAILPSSWEEYPSKQIDSVIAAMKFIISKFPNITRDDVQGHEEIQSNKNDPGPAFPWDHVLDSVFGSKDHDHTNALASQPQEDFSGQYDEESQMCLVPKASP